MIHRMLAVALLGLAASSTGCALCAGPDDYCGSYYGGKVGDWVAQDGRAGSVYGVDAVPEGEMLPPTE